MSNRTLTYMIIGMVVGIAILLMINLLSVIQVTTPDKYISPNNVRGSAVEHNQLSYTLNFAQQNTLISLLNRSVPFGITPQPGRPAPDFEKIVIYQFNNAPDIIIIPIAYVDDGLLFSVPAWNPNGYLIDVSHGELKTLLSQIYSQ